MELPPKIKALLNLKSFFALLLTVYAVWLVFAYRYHFIDNTNLIFHEAGHFLFVFFGDYLQFLGGSIFQLLIPLGIAGYFAMKRDMFAAAFCGIWLGESLMNVAVYVGDAKVMSLHLIGGTHDFNWLFTRWNLLEEAILIGKGLHICASIIVIISLLFMYRSLWSVQGKARI